MRNHIDALENGCKFGDGCGAAALQSKDPAIIDCVNNYYAYLQYMRENTDEEK